MLVYKQLAPEAQRAPPTNELEAPASGGATLLPLARSHKLLALHNATHFGQTRAPSALWRQMIHCPDRRQRSLLLLLLLLLLLPLVYDGGGGNKSLIFLRRPPASHR